MKTSILCATLFAATLSATSGFAATSGIVLSHRADYYAAGRHQFYAWCQNGRDRILRQEGTSAADAQNRLAQKSAGCHLAWQGRIAS